LPSRPLSEYDDDPTAPSVDLTTFRTLPPPVRRPLFDDEAERLPENASTATCILGIVLLVAWATVGTLLVVG
jgi:hypothetical protein